MDGVLFVSYLAAAALCIAAPGPDSLSTLGIGLGHGRREGAWFGIGVGAGALTHTLWAAAGVSALVATSPTVFLGLKFAGALYLVWLGVQAWRAGGSLALPPTAGGGASSLRRFRQGFVSNALNPKVMLFFLGFVPQFVDPHGMPVHQQMLLLGSCFAIMTTLAYGALGALAGRAGDRWLRHPSAVRLLNRLTGTLFVALAVRLLWPDRRV